jgi:hypothetical protein
MTIAGTTTHGEPDPVAANDAADATVVLAAPTPPTAPPEASPGGSLPLTGADVLGLALLALGAVTAGVVAVHRARRGRGRNPSART